MKTEDEIRAAIEACSIIYDISQNDKIYRNVEAYTHALKWVIGD